jgi:hypothetical protein
MFLSEGNVLSEACTATSYIITNSRSKFPHIVTIIRQLFLLPPQPDNIIISDSIPVPPKPRKAYTNETPRQTHTPPVQRHSDKPIPRLPKRHEYHHQETEFQLRLTRQEKHVLAREGLTGV